MKFGIDRLISERDLRAPLSGKRVALLAHPASVTENLTHSLDALAACGDIKISAAFGPQHGLRGDKQDNMIESPDFKDPVHGIPVFSLYGDVRRPTDAMMDACDAILVDLVEQAVGAEDEPVAGVGRDGVGVDLHPRVDAERAEPEESA